jgi:structure-specific endonuclease subunit SLX1
VKGANTAAEPAPASLDIIQDFPPSLEMPEQESGASPKSKKQKPTHGIGALCIDYNLSRPHIEKGKSIIDFEREGSCAVCHVELEHDSGIYTICPNSDCEAVTHMTCLSQHFLSTDEDALVPTKGNCPVCKTEIQWVDVVKELTLRMRGQKEVEKLLKKKGSRKGKVTAQDMAYSSGDDNGDDASNKDESDNEVEERADFIPLAGFRNEWHAIDDSEPSDTESIYNGASNGDGERADFIPLAGFGNEWHAIDDSELSDTESISSDASRPKSQPSLLTSKTASNATTLPIVIEDSDWDEAEVID